MSSNVKSRSQNNEGTGLDDGLTILKASDASTIVGTTVFWDDATILGGSSNLPNGVTSSTALTGAHRHTWGDFTGGSIGDENYIDTYTYGRSSTHLSSAKVGVPNTAPVINNDILDVDEDAILTTSVGTVAASDADGDFVEFSITAGNTGNAFAIDSLTGEITVIASLDRDTISQYLLTVQVSDQAQANSATITIDINNINESPIANAQAVTVTEDIAKAITLTGSDGDSDPLTYTVVTSPSNGVLSGSGANLAYSPNNNYVGGDSFTFKVNDGAIDSTTANVTLTVTDNNLTPVANTQAISVIEDIAKAITLTGSDGDSDPLTYTVVTSPSNGMLSGSGANLAYSPNNNYVGGDSFTFKVNDGSIDSPTATVTITVTDNNQTPVANDQAITVTEDIAKAITLTGSDGDSDPLTFTVVTSPSNGVLSGSGANLAYSPNNNYVGGDSFTFLVNDGVIDSTTATVTITVSDNNQTPVANAQAISVTEDIAEAIILTGSDGDGDILTYTVVTSPINGALSGSGANLTYTPNSNYVGSDNFTFKVNDGVIDSATATISIAFNDNNQIPIANVQSISVTEDIVKAIILTGSDDDDDSLTYSVVNPPSNGSLKGSGANIFYTPNNNYVGSDSFTFKVNDGTVDSATATISITVSDNNQTPVANTQTLLVIEDSAKSVTLMGSDDDGDNLTYSVVNSPSNGSLRGSGANLTYTPNSNYVGSDSFTFMVNDGAIDSAPALITITIEKENTKPIAIDDNALLKLNETTLIINVLDNDIGDGPLTVIHADTVNGQVIINNENMLIFTRTNSDSDSAIVNYTITDENGLSASAVVYITIVLDEETANLPPVAVDDFYQFTTVTSQTLDVLINDYDPEEEPLSLVATTSNFGTVEISNNQLIFTPTENSYGELVISYTIEDIEGAQSVGQIIVKLLNDNAPIFPKPQDLCDQLSLNAQALYTKIELVPPHVIDQVGNQLPVSLKDGLSHYPPGINQLIWQVVDAEGNTSYQLQNVCINPLVSFDLEQALRPGETVIVSIHLNGLSPDYPLTVPYDISMVDNQGEIITIDTIAEITLGTKLYINVSQELSNTQIFEVLPNIEMAILPQVNEGNHAEHNANYIDINFAPRSVIQIMQSQEKRLTVERSGGAVTLTAQLKDSNPEDTLNYYWEVSSLNLGQDPLPNEALLFDAKNLMTGTYQLSLIAKDSASPMNVTETQFFIKVVESLPLLTSTDSDEDGIADNIEGHNDDENDGIANYQDSINECNVLPHQWSQDAQYLIEVQPGICLRLGGTALAVDAKGADIEEIQELSMSTYVVERSNNVLNTGGLFDYVAYDLAQEMKSIAIVIPQKSAIAEQAVYQQFDQQFDQQNDWNLFVEDTSNSLWSTLGEPGYCPPPNLNPQQNIWQPGLTAGHWCLQTILTDGGPNDGDGIINSTIVTMGGVGVLITGNQLPQAHNDNYTMLQDKSIILDVLSNDTDGDFDELIITTANGGNGQLTIIDNQIHFVPTANFIGISTINYSISDQHGGSSSAVAIIDVEQNFPAIVNN